MSFLCGKLIFQVFPTQFYLAFHNLIIGLGSLTGLWLSGLFRGKILSLFMYVNDVEARPYITERCERRKTAMGREFVCNPRTRVEIVFFPRYSHAYISKYVQNHKKSAQKNVFAPLTLRTFLQSGNSLPEIPSKRIESELTLVSNLELILKLMRSFCQRNRTENPMGGYENCWISNF